MVRIKTTVVRLFSITLNFRKIWSWRTFFILQSHTYAINTQAGMYHAGLGVMVGMSARRDDDSLPKEKWIRTGELRYQSWKHVTELDGVDPASLRAFVLWKGRRRRTGPEETDL